MVILDYDSHFVNVSVLTMMVIYNPITWSRYNCNFTTKEKSCLIIALIKKENSIGFTILTVIDNYLYMVYWSFCSEMKVVSSILEIIVIGGMIKFANGNISCLIIGNIWHQNIIKN